MNAERDNKEVSVETRTITEIQSEPICATGRFGPVIARIPVVISQSKVHISIESEVCFGHSVLEICSYSRNVYLTGCKLLNLGNRRHGKIYLNGHVSEKIEYAADCLKDKGCKDKTPKPSDMLYKTLKVPFECLTKIEYCTRPVFKTSNGFIPVGLVNVSNNHDAPCFSNGRFFCELDEAAICESNLIRENVPHGDNVGDLCAFDTLTEYMVVSVSFSLLQCQQVRVPGYFPYNAQ